ncbi:MAG: alpha/beta hydrolase [Bauldia sp.]
MSGGESRSFALDPGIARFVDHMMSGANPGCIPIAELRSGAAARRKPLNAGGPVMAETRDLLVPAEDIPAAVRLHMPATPPSGRVIVYVHGGGWTIGSIETHDRVMREHAAATGAVVAGVGYALAPEAPYPAALMQVVAVVRWLAAGGVPELAEVVVAGDSAGANLALAACLYLRDCGGPLPRAALLAYGAFDPALDSPSCHAYGDAGLILGADRMRMFWKCYLGERPEAADAYAAPARADLAGLPPVHLVIAEHDILRDENLGLAARLADAGNPAEHRVYPGTTHAFLEAVGMAEPSRRAIDDQAAWLGRTLGSPPVEPVPGGV